MSWWVILPLQMEALEEVTLYYHGGGNQQAIQK